MLPCSMKRLLAFLCLFLCSLGVSATNIQQLIQLVDYVGVDYGGAVENGLVINTFEYNEMQDFSGAIAEQVAALPDSAASRQLGTQAAELARLVEARADAAEVKALTAAMRQTFINGYDVTVTPRGAPDLAAAGLLFTEQCASCHGMNGRGDGALAASMDPPPTDFTERARYMDRTVMGLYNTISQGLEGTAMQAYTGLDESQRWALAFYVGQMAASVQEKEYGAEQYGALAEDAELRQIEYIATRTPAENRILIQAVAET